MRPREAGPDRRREPLSRRAARQYDSPECELAVFATDTELQTRNLLQKNQRFFVVASSGQVFETPDFGKYHAKYTVTSVAVQANVPITGNQISPGPIFTRLTLDVTLTAK